MENENVKTVTIPLDEYFELRQKAEANAFIMNELGKYQADLVTVHKRMDELEREVYRTK